MTKDLRLYFYRKKPTNTYSITVNRLSNICQRSLPIASSVCRTYPGVISVLWDTQIYNGLQVHLMNLFFLDVEKLIWHLLLQRFRSKERNNVWRKQECVLSSAGNYQWLKRNGRGKRGDIFYDLFSVSVGKIWLETVLYFLTLIIDRSFDMNGLDKQSCDSLTYMYQQFARSILLCNPMGWRTF